MFFMATARDLAIYEGVIMKKYVTQSQKKNRESCKVEGKFTQQCWDFDMVLDVFSPIRPVRILLLGSRRGAAESIS